MSHFLRSFRSLCGYPRSNLRIEPLRDILCSTENGDHMLWSRPQTFETWSSFCQFWANLESIWRLSSTSSQSGNLMRGLRRQPCSRGLVLVWTCGYFGMVRKGKQDGSIRTSSISYVYVIGFEKESIVLIPDFCVSDFFRKHRFRYWTVSLAEWHGYHRIAPESDSGSKLKTRALIPNYQLKKQIK